jgi:hypothetical protein
MKEDHPPRIRLGASFMALVLLYKSETMAFTLASCSSQPVMILAVVAGPLNVKGADKLLLEEKLTTAYTLNSGNN